MRTEPEEDIVFVADGEEDDGVVVTNINNGFVNVPVQVPINNGRSTVTPTATSTPVMEVLASMINHTAIADDSAKSRIVRINCGGNAFTDASGNQWDADSNYTGGSTYHCNDLSIQGTSNDILYQSCRTGPGIAFYTFRNLPNGHVTINLHFAEVYWDKPNVRLFDIDIEGIKVAKHYDIWSKAGGAKGKAMVETYTAPVTNGTLTILFSTITDQFIISGIEIIPGSCPIPFAQSNLIPASMSACNSQQQNIPVTLPHQHKASFVHSVFNGIRVNCGGNTYIDTRGQVWEADDLHSYYNAGYSCVKHELAVQGTVDDLLYQSVRTGKGKVSYTFPNIPNGYVTIKLHFTEVYWTNPNARVFDIEIEGITVARRYDMLSKAGGKGKVVVETFQSLIKDGKLTITFSTITDQMSVSAIEVIPGSPTAQLAHIMSASLSARGSQSQISPGALPNQPRTFLVDQFNGIRVNCGGDTYIDTVGQVWEADNLHSYYNAGYSCVKHELAVQGTVDDLLYQSVRTGKGKVSYNFPNIPNGYVTIKLHFAEVYWTNPNSRVFDIEIEGITVARRYDMLSKAGGKGKVIVETFQSLIVDGKLTITFTTITDQMSVSAIEVLPMTTF